MPDLPDVSSSARLLIEHDSDRMSCADHDGLCCPAEGCDHGFASREMHQAEQLVAYVRRAQAEAIDGFADWLAKVGFPAPLPASVYIAMLREHAEDIRKAGPRCQT